MTLTVDLRDHVASELGFEYRFEERDIDGLLEGWKSRDLFASAAAMTVASDPMRGSTSRTRLTAVTRI